jgi:hypothetical protein
MQNKRIVGVGTQSLPLCDRVVIPPPQDEKAASGIDAQSPCVDRKMAQGHAWLRMGSQRTIITPWVDPGQMQ